MDSVYHSYNARSTKRGVCCTEMQLDYFSLEDSNGKTLDLQRTFAPTPKWSVFLVKLAIVLWALEVLIGNLLSYPDIYARGFFMANLTHWALSFAELYLVTSLIAQLVVQDSSNKLNWFIKLPWGLFAVASSLQASVTFLFWSVEYDYVSGVTYYNFMKHGGVMILVLLEGLVVNRVPVRFRHIVYPMFISFLYVLWTLIHDILFDVGYPNVDDSAGDDAAGDDAAGDDDAIYTSISWKNRPKETLIISLISIFVLSPVLFLIIYVLSFPMRRYVPPIPTCIVAVTNLAKISAKPAPKAQQNTKKGLFSFLRQKKTVANKPETKKPAAKKPGTKKPAAKKPLTQVY